MVRGVLFCSFQHPWPSEALACPFHSSISDRLYILTLNSVHQSGEHRFFGGFFTCFFRFVQFRREPLYRQPYIPFPSTSTLTFFSLGFSLNEVSPSNVFSDSFLYESNFINFVGFVASPVHFTLFLYMGTRLYSLDFSLSNRLSTYGFNNTSRTETAIQDSITRMSLKWGRETVPCRIMILLLAPFHFFDNVEGWRILPFSKLFLFQASLIQLLSLLCLGSSSYQI